MQDVTEATFEQYLKRPLTDWERQAVQIARKKLPAKVQARIDEYPKLDLKLEDFQGLSIFDWERIERVPVYTFQVWCRAEGGLVVAWVFVPKEKPNES